MPVEFLPCADSALTVQFGEHVDRALSNRVVHLKKSFDRVAPSGILDTVPTFRSLTIHYDPLRIAMEDLIGLLEPLLEVEPEGDAASTCWRLPVCYDPEMGLDLEEVARLTNLTPERVVEMHTSVRHHIYMLGFSVGTPYMGDLPKELYLPRRETPRVRVPAGSVAIAIGQTTIYTYENAGGWHILGLTPAPLFNLSWDHPVLLAPGDAVICEAISKDEYTDILQQVDAGTYRMKTAG